MLVTPEQFERSLDWTRAHAAGTREGLFGPASATWQVDREAAVFLGAGRALLLQLAHPWVAAAIADQSHVFADPVGRFHRTFSVTYTMVFGSTEQALAAARRLYQRHTTVEGIVPERAGPFAAGSPYQANEVAALRWVHATLVETALMAHDLVLPPLASDARERYWSESRLYAGLFGIPPDHLGPDWASFVAYNSAMHESDVLTVIPPARQIVRQIFSGSVTGIQVPRWYRALTAQMLPQRLRCAFELSLGEAELRSAQRAVKRIRRLYPLLPDRLRTVGPYQEALARMRGRDRPPAVTRWLNRLWIGRPTMNPAAPDAVERSPSGP